MGAHPLDRLKREAELGDIEAMRVLLIEVRRRNDDTERWSQRIARAAQEARAWPLLREAATTSGEAWIREQYPVLGQSAHAWRLGLRCAQALMPELWTRWWVDHIDPLKVTPDNRDYEHWAAAWVLTLEDTPLPLKAVLQRAAPLTPHGGVSKRHTWRFLKKNNLITRHPDRSLSLAEDGLPALPALPQCALCADTGSCSLCQGTGCDRCEHTGSCHACFNATAGKSRSRRHRYLRSSRIRNIPRLRKRSTARRRKR